MAKMTYNKKIAELERKLEEAQRNLVERDEKIKRLKMERADSAYLIRGVIGRIKKVNEMIDRSLMITGDGP